MPHTHIPPAPKKRERTRLRLQKRQALPRLAYTVSELAEITSLSKAHVYRLMARGQLQFTQLGGTRRIPASELVRLGLAGA
jgi:excisionase family DNA binding protein